MGNEDSKEIQERLHQPFTSDPTPDEFYSTPDPGDERARQRWVEDAKKLCRMKGCFYFTAALADGADGKTALVVAGWKTNPDLLM